MSKLPAISAKSIQNFNFALKFQPQAFASLTLIAWGQTLYYHKSAHSPPTLLPSLTHHSKWRAWTATLATIALAASFGLMELILILTLRGPYTRGVQWPMMLMAISASVIQVVGLIPPYFELAKRNGRVIGIDFWFLTIDYAGAFFSLMAVVAQQWFDALGASLYIACMVLETGIFASQAIWLWRVRYVRKEAKRKGLGYDEYVKKYANRGERVERVVDVEAGTGETEDDAGREKVDLDIPEKKTGDAKAVTPTEQAADAGPGTPQPPPKAVTTP